VAGKGGGGVTDRSAVTWSAQLPAVRLTVWVALEEGRPVELRVVCGGPLELILADLSTAITLGLARGVPLERYMRVYRGRSDETRGLVTGDIYVTEAGSVADYLAKALIARFP
jgi:hypothetical protein